MQPFPDVVRIEASGRCNFRCQHCPIGREGGKRPVLGMGAFWEIFDSLPIIPRVLVLYHGGEPLINKHLEDMILYAKKAGVEKTVINTNASLLTMKRGQALARAGLDEMRISFDGDSPTENDAIRIGSLFNKAAPIVRELALSPIRPETITIYNVRRGHDTPALYLREYFADCRVNFRGEKMREWARVNNEPKITNGVRFCSNLFETFTILSDGSVPMCCEDLQLDDPQGNVFNEAPIKIWRHMQAIRDAFDKKSYRKLCQSCWVVTR